jgi:hypothetical protein
MRALQDLQVALRERYRRCLTQRYEVLSQETAVTRDWICKQPALIALLEDAARAEPDVDVTGWVDSFNASSRFAWPSKTEAGRATLAWALMNAVADFPQADRAVIQYGHGLRTGGNLNDDARELVERIYQPLFDYLIDHVAAEGSVLYTLDIDYSADTANGEAVYDRALRRFLFSEGINMPYSQAKSASGISDVLSNLESEDPLVCEVKLFIDDKRSIAGGLHQAILYAQDYGKSAAYLVIMNLSGRPLTLPSDGAKKEAPPFLDVSGVRVYFLPIRALPPAKSASKAGRARPVVMTRRDLVDPG